MHIISQQFKFKQLFPFIKYKHADSIYFSIEEERLTSMLHLMRDVFVTYFQEDLFSQWLEQIVREKFLYSDREECHQIVELATSIMQEDTDENKQFKELLDQKIYQGLSSMFERQVSFSFPSFLTFRLRGVMEPLIVYVELAIDEYKMEQDYQSFIHTLRQYMLTVSSKMDHLHLFHDQYFRFYNTSYKQIPREEMASFIDRKLFTEYPMYIDSHVLAPLISIAPKQISIYTAEEETPLLMTISRIFEERVTFSTHDVFKKNEIKL